MKKKKYYGAVTQYAEKKLWLVSELMIKGSLNDLLKKSPTLFNLPFILKMAKDIAKGMVKIKALPFNFF